MASPSDPVHLRLEQLLTAFGARVKVLLSGYGLDKHGIDPADVEQEVRIRLWHALERDRSGAFHASYVQRVVASTVIDALRRAQVRAAEPLPDEDDGSVGLEATQVAPDRRAGDLERMQGLKRCLDGIPERRRLPIALHLQGFSLQEIAELADIPSAEAARKLVSRGLEELKQRLRDLGLGEFED
ncbi:MAG: sigma-70 family RNA polymerase sigma factor [Dokdonella sp.]|uniref:RNA polymerase sigma factor n=1 Tax=Dokdonella sp. TaxID=2291710 RepID=UPI0025BA2A5E|nr:sigma-70 family RNA polymerase sigma factor [Dokdonella sp.]MBZ0223523.1 sigma-70 family RNA polymerase sigma factor [Dokdonella sp.]MCC7255056.1 sigma-70 family RNA polymerase sigma factor [Dokdonella sp.]